MLDGGVLCGENIVVRALALLKEDALLKEVARANEGADVLDAKGGAQFQGRHIASTQRINGLYPGQALI